MSWLDTKPRKRVSPARSYLEISIDHEGGTEQYDPNRLLGAAATLQILRLQPLPGVTSILSGHPAVTFHDTDLALNLTPRELTRLACHNLMPEEYFALVARFGMAYNWHSDFYRSDTGAQRNPVFSEGEHEYAEIMQGETAPPDEAWPRYSNLKQYSDQELRSILVQHPAVVTGYWQVQGDGMTHACPSDFDKLSRLSLISNLLSLNNGREACLGPSEAQAHEVLRTASNPRKK